MVKKASHSIYMPKKEEILRVFDDFEQVSYLLRVIGAIDGSRIRIIAPSEDEYANVNRKRYHSINIQAMCNANLIFRDVVAKWPGPHHDSFILEASTMRDRFESGEFGNCWLLGDSGYPLKKRLITPYGNPVTHKAKRFNIYHRKTRCVIERSFGVLKMRWRILDRKLCYKPGKVSKITVACCLLHNICRRSGVTFPEVGDANGDRSDIDDTGKTTSEENGDVVRQRNRIVGMLRSMA